MTAMSREFITQAIISLMCLDEKRIKIRQTLNRYNSEDNDF